jgi:beta-N-acetylhexosaminidase
MLGFFGSTLPKWIKDFESKYGLGGVILFDYYVQTKKYENNIFSLEQLKELCSEIKALPSSPLIFIDQEGGKVRRLKSKLGFEELPSAKSFNLLEDQSIFCSKAFQQ